MTTKPTRARPPESDAEWLRAEAFTWRQRHPWRAGDPEDRGHRLGNIADRLEALEAWAAEVKAFMDDRLDALDALEADDD